MATETQAIRVKASALQAGDVLSGGRVVTTSAYRGVATPSGKVTLGVNGFRAVWNASTEILIERKGN